MGLELPNRPKIKKEAIVCEGCGTTHNEEKCPSCGRFFITNKNQSYDNKNKK
jgi:rubrerythrin